MTPEKKCPDTLAGAIGAGIHAKHVISLGKDKPKSRQSAMSKYAKPSHKRAAKALGYALTVADGAAWEAFTAIIMARLTWEERVGIAWAALNSLDDDTAYLTASASLYGVAYGEVLA